MSAENGKWGPSVGEVLKAGLEDLRAMTVAFPTPTTAAPQMDIDM